MTTSKDQDVVLSSDRPSRALLLELKSERPAGDGTATIATTEMFAALSMEEVLAYVRTRRQDAEITELKVLGKVQVLSSSEHLE
ncbi:MAG: hypothetical protein WDN23_13140 [Edaphobacter sp.]